MTESVFCPKGIADPTPAQAAKLEQHAQPQPGDVWINAKGFYQIILSVQQGFCVTLTLTSNDRMPQAVYVEGNMMYCNPRMLEHLLLRNYGNYLTTLPVATMQELMHEAQAALGVETGNLVSMREEINELRAERDKFRKDCARLVIEKNSAEMSAGLVDRMKRHIAALKQEISAYKRTCRILANELRYTKPVEEGTEDEDR